jgi:hypothetical protein
MSLIFHVWGFCCVLTLFSLRHLTCYHDVVVVQRLGKRDINHSTFGPIHWSAKHTPALDFSMSIVNTLSSPQHCRPPNKTFRFATQLELFAGMKSSKLQPCTTIKALRCSTCPSRRKNRLLHKRPKRRRNRPGNKTLFPLPYLHLPHSAHHTLRRIRPATYHNHRLSQEEKHRRDPCNPNRNVLFLQRPRGSFRHHY